METDCPKCGSPRNGAAVCPRCGLIFERYRPRPAARAPRPAEPPAARIDSGEPRVGPLRRAYRVFRWVVLAACVLVVVLILKRSPPPEIHEDPGATRRLAAKLDALALATARGEAHVLTLAEPELNAWLRQNLALQGLEGVEDLALPVDPAEMEKVRSNVRDLRVKLADDRVRAYVVFDFHGQDLSLSLEGRLHVQDGYLRFTPTAALLGSLPLPRATLDRAVGRLFDDPANRETFRLPPDVRDVRVEDGQVVVVVR